jgi:hypothetical protein
MTDADGNGEDRKGTVSVFNGIPSTIRSFATEADEISTIGEWMSQQVLVVRPIQ